MTEYKLPTKADLKQVPKNKVVKAVVVEVSINTWRELILDPEKLKKFDKPDEPQVCIKYDAEGFIREEKFSYTENPTTTSRFGRYIVRYDTPIVGQEIEINFNEDSKAKIIVAS